jgi:hypothetical protein
LAESLFDPPKIARGLQLEEYYATGSVSTHPAFLPSGYNQKRCLTPFI